MPLEAALFDPDEGRRVFELSSSNPFMTEGFVEAMRRHGFQPWHLTGREATGEARSAIGYVRGGRLNRGLTLPTMPRLSAGAPFWLQLIDTCRQLRVTQLSVATAGSEGVEIPQLVGETARIARTEFVLDLRAPDLWAGVGKSHRERIKKAKKLGATVERSRSADALRAHVELHRSSMERRHARGENVPLDEDDGFMRALLETGAGELYQAVLEGRVLSSLLMIRSATGAYSHSSGNSSEGMSIGASHFLRYETACAMRELGIEDFYLGGARPHETGLVAYKKGFGARQIPMTSVEAYVGSVLRRRISTAIHLARHDPWAIAQFIAGRAEHYVVYAANASDIEAPEECPDWVMSKLSDQELLTLPNQELPEVRLQGERLQRGRVNDAWGLRVGGKLAGICWMIPYEHDRHYSVRNVRLRRGEVEITHCVTMPLFRGQGVYPYMIRKLCVMAAKQGIQRVFMITNVSNTASQRGMEKAGMKPHGTIVRHLFPVLPNAPALTWRGHRWRDRIRFG